MEVVMQGVSRPDTRSWDEGWSLEFKGSEYQGLLDVWTLHREMSW